MSSDSDQLAWLVIGFLSLTAIFLVFHKRRSGWSWAEFAVEADRFLRKFILLALAGHPWHSWDDMERTAPEVLKWRVYLLILLVALAAAALVIQATGN